MSDEKASTSLQVYNYDNQFLTPVTLADVITLNNIVVVSPDGKGLDEHILGFCGVCPRSQKRTDAYEQTQINVPVLELTVRKPAIQCRQIKSRPGSAPFPAFCVSVAANKSSQLITF